jgi:hypothetical protein
MAFAAWRIAGIAASRRQGGNRVIAAIAPTQCPHSPRNLLQGTQDGATFRTVSVSSHHSRSRPPHSFGMMWSRLVAGAAQ